MVGETYESAGVNLNALDGLKDRIKAFTALTHGPEVLDPSGSFAGQYNLSGYNNPVLVASTDGVGTKLKIAAQLGHYESIGQDLVTLNVNDIITKGAKPLFFLDYISFSNLDEHCMETLLRGMVWGCKEVGCAFIGGETAQIPDTYIGDDLDIAGFVVGVTEKDEALPIATITPGDYLIGIPSTGLHTNGFSLARKVFNLEQSEAQLFQYNDVLNHSLGEELLTKHRAYYPLLKPIFPLIKGLAHITGGGLPGKLPSILPHTATAEFQRGSWNVPRIFSLIQQQGGIEESEMYRVFNMGLGMVAVCEPESVATIQDAIPDSLVVGQIITRDNHPPVILG